MNLDGFDFAKPLPPIKKTLKAKPKAKPKTVEPAPKPKVITNNEAWSVKYVPSKSIDLAVNVKKVGEIKAWLQQNTASKRPGILLLTGPPGCGKTATVKVLAKELQASIQEWSNPTENVTYSQDYSADDIPYVSQTNSFRNFMIRAGKYKLLGGGRHKLILIEDLPPFAIRKTTDFHDIIRHVNRLFPLIFIHSETSGKEDLKKLKTQIKNLKNEITMKSDKETQTDLSANQIEGKALAKKDQFITWLKNDNDFLDFRKGG